MGKSWSRIRRGFQKKKMLLYILAVLFLLYVAAIPNPSTLGEQLQRADDDAEIMLSGISLKTVPIVQVDSITSEAVASRSAKSVTTVSLSPSSSHTVVIASCRIVKRADASMHQAITLPSSTCLFTPSATQGIMFHDNQDISNANMDISVQKRLKRPKISMAGAELGTTDMDTGMLSFTQVATGLDQLQLNK